ncbi:bacteriophage Gp15 family protein [Paraclostridium bifermentans]|uniref:bacteriophage Gp15 family protein n=1 Tax=Paraclostridium bifermentans TaxID=1490 RepID=UPI0011DE59B5|nr:bacteriophage Gp15 family protein [Paraclostridium bifermentans]
MNNILIDILPKSVIIDDLEYEINSNFRESILFEQLMQVHEFSDEEKIYQALSIYYPKIPKNLNEAIKEMLSFYKCGKEEEYENTDSNASKSSSTKIYDFDYDADYIYSAFLSQYNIDLQDVEYLHWWKFKAMFNGLNSDNKIVEIMGYRSIKLNSIKDEKQRKHYRKLQKLYKLPINKNEYEKQSELNKALLSGDVNTLNELLVKGSD